MNKKNRSFLLPVPSSAALALSALFFSLPLSITPSLLLLQVKSHRHLVVSVVTHHSSSCQIACNPLTDSLCVSTH